jgi:hypothetical protein
MMQFFMSNETSITIGNESIMRSTKGTRFISVSGTRYRWRALGGDECISVGIWPENGVGAYIGGNLGYHNTWLPQDDMLVSPGDQVIVTNRLVRRIIEHAIFKHGYDPNVKAKQLHLKALDDTIRWDDAVRGC